jgi:hypothetical protein
MNPDDGNETLHFTDHPIGLEPGILVGIGNAPDKSNPQLRSYALDTAARTHKEVENWAPAAPIPGLTDCDLLATINPDQQVTLYAAPGSPNEITVYSTDGLTRFDNGAVQSVDFRSLRYIAIGRPGAMASLKLRPESHEVGTSGKWQYNLVRSR